MYLVYDYKTILNAIKYIVTTASISTSGYLYFIYTSYSYYIILYLC